MNGDAPASSEDQSSCPLPDWKEFCELHARTSASEFACKFRRFVRENPCYDSPGADTSFSQHFARYFLECFAAELSRAPGPGSPAEPRYSVAPFAGLQGCLLPYSYEFCQRYKDKAASSESLDSMDNRTGSAAARATSSAHKAPVLGQSRSSEDVSAGHSKVCFKKGFSLRNVSLCVVDGVREIWHRRSSPEPDGERRGSRLRLPRAVRSRKAQPMEVQREGSLRYMVADDTSCTGGSQWQKCRLLLRRTEAQAEGERFVLEFYVPPKSSKPKVSVPMSAILEVRTTMPLEMPDKDNTFVLKVDNGAEYILETIDSLQKNSWVADIQDCMDPGDSGDDIELASFLHGQHPRDLPVASSCSCELLSEGVHRPPQRSCAPVAENYITPSICSGESHFTQHPMHVPLERFLQTPVCQARGAVTAGHAEEATEVEGNSSLARYPWFHGTLSRVRAAQLVLMGGARSHGLFVIRQSETRPGEYVLTFNFQGKAKMWVCRSPLRCQGILAAGVIRTSPSQSTMSMELCRQADLWLRGLPRPAPLRHPVPLHPTCPVSPRLALGCRAAATAQSACWNPTVLPLRTTKTMRAQGGPERWKTSIPSTEAQGWPLKHIKAQLWKGQRYQHLPVTGGPGTQLSSVVQ
uniref:SH2B adaptor protein 2 n=1 Tax=Scleropages formosus TaxID=113540 RepID=A0A8C9VRA0_SCLFO